MNSRPSRTSSASEPSGEAEPAVLQRVLFIAPQPFFEPRGTPINVKEFVTRLSDLCLRTDLLVLPHGQDVEIPAARIVRCPRLPGIRRVPIGPSLRKLFYDFLLLVTAIRLCLRNDYEVVHGVEEGAILAGLIGAVFHLPYVVDMDSCIPDELRRAKVPFRRALASCYERLERWAVRRASLVITVSKHLTAHVRSMCPSVPVIQIDDCPLDGPAPRTVMAAHSGMRRSCVTYLYTGNLEDYQGIDLLLRSVAHAIASDQRLRSKIRLIIVGGEADQLRSKRLLVKELDIESCVELHGRQPPEKMFEYMDAADILVSPRRVGGNTPLKLYSYMQSGKPIIATRVDAHTSVLNDEHAFLAHAEVADLANVIRRTCQLTEVRSPELGKRAEQARQLVERSYSREVFGKNVLAAYRALDERVAWARGLPPAIAAAGHGTVDPDTESATPRYAKRFSGAVGAYLLGRQTEILERLLARHPHGSLRILDIGGGHAQLTEVMLRGGHDVTVHGSDQTCRTLLDQLGLTDRGVKFVTCPIAKLGSHLGTFDVVTAFRMMAHVPDWERFLAQLTALAGREVIIDFASLYSSNLLSRPFFPLKRAIESDTRRFICQRPADVVAAFERLGFGVTALEKELALPLAVHRGVGRVGFSRRSERLCRQLGITEAVGSPVIVRAERLKPRA